MLRNFQTNGAPSVLVSQESSNENVFRILREEVEVCYEVKICWILQGHPH